MDDTAGTGRLAASDSLPPIAPENVFRNELIPEPTPKPKLGQVKKQRRKEKLYNVDVHIKIKFLKLGDINTAQEMFKATVFLQARWLEPQLDHPEKTGGSFELLNYEDYWDPELHVDNVLDEGKVQTWYMVSYNRHGRASIIKRATIRGSFHENMELKQFPFDTQDITITVATKLGGDKINLHADSSDQVMNTSSFSDCSEWFLHEDLFYSVHNPTSTQIAQVQAAQRKRRKHRNQVRPRQDQNPYGLPSLPISDEEDSTGLNCDDEENLPRASTCLMAKATRKPLFYVLNITLFMMILGALIFSTFAIECTLVGNRLQTTSTIMLSNIAFKLAVGNAMPRVSYFTYMDFYILLSLVQMGLVLAWHAIVSQLCIADDDGDIPEIALIADKIAIGVLGCFYIVFNCMFLTKNLVRVYNRVNTSNSNSETTVTT